MLCKRLRAETRTIRHRVSGAALKLIAQAFDLRPHDSRDLDEVHLGLWQGLTRAELKFRYPSAFPQWEENPLAVNAPDGEPIPDAMDRLRRGMARILRKQRGAVVALALRPMAMQIVLGLLQAQDTQTIAGHLHNTSVVETMSIADDVLDHLIS